MPTTKLRVPVGVGLLLVNKEGKILLHRRKGSHGAGTWAFPGGAVDPGEDPFDTVYRELHEEAGIKQSVHGLSIVEVWNPVPWVNSIHAGVDAGQQWVTLYFIAAHDGQEPRVMEPEKNDGWKWWDITELQSAELFLPLKQVHSFLFHFHKTPEFHAYKKRAIDLAKGT